MKIILKALMLSSVAGVALSLPAAAQSNRLANFVPVTDEVLAHPADADWLSWRRTANMWGYSPLDQINKDNVGKLQVVWSRAMSEGNQEGTPLVYNGVMYLPNPKDHVQALDATTGDLLWEYRRELPTEGLGLVITRSLAIWGDKIVLLSKDNFIVALNATTGEVAWETPLRENGSGSQTSGVIIANGKAISGRNCANVTSAIGGPQSCFVAAHDLQTGEELWRFYTIPQAGTPGDDTWVNVPYEARRHVGSWITPSYDPDLNLVYVGTSVTSPYAKFYYAAPDHLDDDFLYQTSTLALDADTGELKWSFQHIRDQWDLDHPFERYLIDTPITPDAGQVRWISPNATAGGGERRVLTGIPGKTGIFYSIDRATGEFLWARETVHQTAVLEMDTTTGRATMNMEAAPKAVGETHVICPAAVGGKDWPAGAYSPLTHAIYYPMQNLCMSTFTSDVNLQLGPYQMAPGETNVGTVRGINVATGDELWKWENRAAVTALVATGGGLLFGGDVNRRFRAFDQDTGKVLFETILSAQVGGFPISYGVDGKQYVAIPVGSMLISGAYLGMTPELKPGTGGNAVFVFALPDA